MLSNYSEARHWYAYEVDESLAATDNRPGLAIVTTNTISETMSSELRSFRDAKDGLRTYLVTENHYGQSTPEQRPQKIRRWLQDHYLSDRILYVLLVGNPVTSIADTKDGYVPMQVTWPYGQQQGYATDLYYADLTGNWDRNKDGFYANDGDYGPGGVDFQPEVYVGRIPVYPDTIADLKGILEKSTDYEESTDQDWRRSILMPMGFLDNDTDSAHVADKMTTYLDRNGFRSHTMYYHGWECKSSLASDGELEPGKLQEYWIRNAVGIATLIAHGNPQLALFNQHCTKENKDPEDQVKFHNTDAKDLNDSMPAIVVLSGCAAAKPDHRDNLAYALLQNGAVATVAATNASNYFPGPFSPDRSHGDELNLVYYYVENIVGGMSTGEALAAVTGSRHIDPHDKNAIASTITFVLYGDPSIHLSPGPTGRVSLGAGGKPADGSSYNPSISADGRFVAFESDATNFVDQAAGARAIGVFVYDRHNGVTTVVEMDREQRYTFHRPVISADGRYLAYEAKGMDDVGHFRTRIKLWDREAGVSEFLDGATSWSESLGNSSDPTVSSDGRYVVFQSNDAALIADDFEGDHIFVYDVNTKTTTLISTGVDGKIAPGGYNPSISGSGRFVVYEGTDWGYCHGIIVHDTDSQNTWIRALDDCDQDDYGVSYPSISTGGEYMTWVLSCYECDSQYQIDTIRVASLDGEEIYSFSSDEKWLGEDRWTTFADPVVSQNGNYVAFTAEPGAGDADPARIVVYERASNHVTRGSVNALGAAGNRGSSHPQISADGRYVVFQTQADNLAGGDTNGKIDIFVHDLAACIPAEGNLLENFCFEDRRSGWRFSPASAGHFVVSDAEPFDGHYAAEIRIDQAGTALQLYQSAIDLNANSKYELSFAAYSSDGSDMNVRVHRHSPPFTAFDRDSFNRVRLTTEWHWYTIVFDTPRRVTNNDARLRFWFKPYAQNGTVYHIDRVVLRELAKD
jgi:Tol biopolymer transport system component